MANLGRIMKIKNIKENNFREFVDNYVPGRFTIVMILAVIEIVIFLSCVVVSHDKDIMKITNKDNEIVYERSYDAPNILEFKRLYGIRSFNKEGYTVKRYAMVIEFPARAWIALSICVPMALVMFIVFVVKVFADVDHLNFKNQGRRRNKKSTSGFEDTHFEKLFSTLERMNIYTLGFTILMVVFLYWVIPDLLIYVSKVSFQTISDLKWVVFGLVILAVVFLIFTIYFSHKTKTEFIRQQAEIQKNRDLLAIENLNPDAKLLEDKSDFSEDMDDLSEDMEDL